MAERHKWSDVIIAMANGQEVQYKDGTWTDRGESTSNPISNPGWEWRIKPRTIMIGDMEVPEPLRVDPEVGSVYFLVNATRFLAPSELVWQGNCDDLRWLSYGLIHTSKSAAIVHGRAIVRITSV